MKENLMQNYLNLFTRMYNNFLSNFRDDYYVLSTINDNINDKTRRAYYLFKVNEKNKIYDISKEYLFDLLILGEKTNKKYYENSLIDIFLKQNQLSEFLKIVNSKENFDYIENPNVIKEMEKSKIFLNDLETRSEKRFYAYNFFYISQMMKYKSKVVKKETNRKSFFNNYFCNHIKKRLIEENLFSKEFFENLDDKEFEKFLQNVIYMIYLIFFTFSKCIKIKFSKKNHLFKEKYSLKMIKEDLKDYEFFYKINLLLENSTINPFSLKLSKKEKIDINIKSDNDFFDENYLNINGYKNILTSLFESLTKLVDVKILY